jgi:hypothetical protein
VTGPAGKPREESTPRAGRHLNDADGRISAVTPYGTRQAWWAAIPAYPGAVDGIANFSRHFNLGFAVGPFDRAGSKIRAGSEAPPPSAKYYGALLNYFAVRPF